MIDRREFISLLLGVCATPVMLSACGSSGGEQEASGGEEEAANNSSQIANPFIDCGSAYDAAQLAGFEVTFPESVPGCSERRYQAIESQMAQCIYSEGDIEVLIRKAAGTEDISGDYNEYGQTSTVDVDGTEVTERGDTDLVFAATWVRDGYSFAIDANKGLAPEDVEHLVQATL